MEPNLPQTIVNRIAGYQQEEYIWIDQMVRAQWPNWFTSFAERGNNIFYRILQLFIARNAGLEIKRNQHNELVQRPKGFRDRSVMMCKNITCTLYKHQQGCKMVQIAGGEMTRPNCTEKCVVGKKVFEMNVPLQNK